MIEEVLQPSDHRYEAACDAAAALARRFPWLEVLDTDIDADGQATSEFSLAAEAPGVSEAELLAGIVETLRGRLAELEAALGEGPARGKMAPSVRRPSSPERSSESA